MGFVYPSTANSEELRLLEPLSITQDSLHFNLIKVSRTAAAAYTAVSYTWGDGEASEHIYLNNQTVFHVRPNLWSCLYYLGQDAQRVGIKLWADAICIDQSNPAERNSQVRRMDETYQRAAHVSVWLGLPSIPNDLYIPDHLKPVKTLEVDPFDWCDHLDDLANRPYWSRVWVIQECLLPENIVLYCGNTKMLWNDFRNTLCRQADITEHEFDASFGTPGHAANSATTSFAALPLVMARHVDKHPELSQSLHELLISHHRAECKDLRDKTFGLLGLVTPVERRLLERFFPDCTMSEDHVRIIALAHVLQYNVPNGAPEVNTESNELFLGLGCRSGGAERRRLLGRARVQAFDYFDDWSFGQAAWFLTESNDNGRWAFFDEGDEDGDEVARWPGFPNSEDQDFPGVREGVPRSGRRLVFGAGLTLSVAIVALVCWRYGVLRRPGP